MGSFIVILYFQSYPTSRSRTPPCVHIFTQHQPNTQDLTMRNCSHRVQGGCRDCWKRKAKANGARCQSLYWSMQMIMERYDNAIVVPAPLPVNEDEDVRPHDQAKKILERLRKMPADDSDIKGNCVVCYEDFNSTSHKPVALSCGHVVCLSCVSNDLLRRCPKCSKDITKIIPLY